MAGEGGGGGGGGAIVGGAAAAGQLIPALIGRGQNKRQATDFTQNPAYDPFANQFGNYGAENYAAGKRQQAKAIDQRGAFTADYTNADQQRLNSLQAREGQNQVAQMMLARARGQVPSIAQMQADRQMQQATAAQASAAASARGPAALALAQQNAANQTANAQGQISGQAQINAANERMQAEQAAFGAQSAMRGQDVTGQGLDANMSQFQAGMQQANRNANDARAMGYEQMGHQAIGAEQQGRVQMQGVLANSHNAAEAQNQNTANQNAQNKGLVDTLGDFFSDARTKYTFPSDFTTKEALQGTPLPSLVGGGGLTTSTMGGGGTNPVSGPAAASFDQITAGGGGMDVMGSLQKHSDFATQYASDPTGGMGGMTFPSDDRTKLAAAWDQGHEAAIADVQKLGRMSPDQLARRDEPIAKAVLSLRGGQRDVLRSERAMPPTMKRSERGQEPSIEQLRAIEAAGGDALDARDRARLRDAGSNQERAQSYGITPAQASEADAFMAEREARARNMRAAEFARSNNLPVVRQPTSFTRDPQPDPRMADATFPSDFTTKLPLKGGTRDAFGDMAEGDPDAPRLRYVPGQGWVNPYAPPKADLDAAIEEQAGQDRDDLDIERRISEQRAKDERAARFAAETSEDAERGVAPGTTDFERTEPKPKAEGEQGKPVAWWEALGSGARALNEAQFGSGGGGQFRSDERTKNVIDLDAEDYGDVDKPEFDQRPKPRSMQFKRDTPADQRRVKRAYEDKASKDADDIMAGYRASLGGDSAVAARLKPSDSPVAQANRTMKGEPYVYKPEFTPPDQKPGELNYGFMAQNLEKSPVTATAVKEDPNGIKRVDALKLLRVLGASVADLQEQQDDTRMAIGALKGGKRKAK